MESNRLTRQQRLADYEYLWKVLNGSFPVRGVMKRLGYDWESIKAKHGDTVSSAADDLLYCRALADVIEDFRERDAERYFAHIRLFEPARFRNYQKMYKAFADGAWEGVKIDEFRPWIDAVNRETSERFYSRFDDVAADGKFYWEGHAPKKLAEGDDPVFRDNEKDTNVACSFISDRVALIRVNTLNMMRIPGDREILFDFYRQHKGCKHLILDFRQNGGGATDYWHKLLVAPTIDEPLRSQNYLTLALSHENREFVRCGLNECKDIGAPDSRVRPIVEMPQLPRFEQEDLEQLTHFVDSAYTIDPDAGNHFDCGRIWLLVSTKVYSSSEAFAVFCKNTGYATLVGERTGGDGLGITPFHAVLPNSGLVIRYSGENGLNQDGSSNAEYCTEPSVVCDSEDALEACLTEIAKGK